MKFAPFLLGLASLALAGSLPAHADSLYPDKITVSGTFQQPPLTTGGPGVVYEATIANILDLLDLSQDPTTLRYYYDDDANAIVIAPKGVKSTDAVTPLVVLYTNTGGLFGTDYIGGKLRPGLFGYGENQTILTSATSEVAVDLNSVGYYKGTSSGRQARDTITVLAHGTIGGTDTIISLKITDGYGF